MAAADDAGISAQTKMQTGLLWSGSRGLRKMRARIWI